MIPQIAAWGKTMIDGALGAAGTNAATVGFDKLGQTGILYRGLETLGGGATLAGIILGAVTVFIIERQLEKARRRLSPYAPKHRGVAIDRLLERIEAAAATVELGSLRLEPPLDA